MLNSAAIARPVRISELYRGRCRVDDAGRDTSDTDDTRRSYEIDVSHDRYCHRRDSELVQYQQENSDAPEQYRFPEQKAAD